MVLSHCAHCAVLIMHSPPNWDVTVDLQRRSHFNEATNYDFSVEQRFLCVPFSVGWEEQMINRASFRVSEISDAHADVRVVDFDEKVQWIFVSNEVQCAVWCSVMQCALLQCAVCIIATTVVLNPLPKVPLSAKDVNPVSPLELKAARVFHSGSKMHLWKMCTANAKFTLSKKKGWKLMFACKSSLLKRC